MTSSYKIVFTDSIGCSDSVLNNIISSPFALSFDTIFTTDINCRGVNSGSVAYSVSGGKQYIINESYLKFVPNNCQPIVSLIPHIDFIKVSNFFYNDFLIDKISL